MIVQQNIQASFYKKLVLLWIFFCFFQLIPKSSNAGIIERKEDISSGLGTGYDVGGNWAIDKTVPISKPLFPPKSDRTEWIRANENLPRMDSGSRFQIFSTNSLPLFKVYGKYPKGSLIQASDGKLYGMTHNGGKKGHGVLFKYNPSLSTYSKKVVFNGNNGAHPTGSLVEASNGKLYGMTKSGGDNGKGILFEYDPVRSNYSKLLDFDGANKGSNPKGSLMEASNGKLYGMTSSGGSMGEGVLFEFDPSDSTYFKLLEFDDTNKGSQPTGSLIEASNGKLYGMTYRGGKNGAGVLFEYTPSTSTYSKMLDFDGTKKGSFPEGSLIEASNGKLYGITSKGGSNERGVLFEFDPTNSSYTKKVDFGGASKGNHPKGSLIEASNGNLYGMTSGKWSNLEGGLFEYDPSTSTLSKMVAFDGTTKGSYPEGSLVEARNGKLYGLTRKGGKNGTGVLFSYDLSTIGYSKELDFSEINKAKIEDSYPQDLLSFFPEFALMYPLMDQKKLDNTSLGVSFKVKRILGDHFVISIDPGFALGKNLSMLSLQGGGTFYFEKAKAMDPAKPPRIFGERPYNHHDEIGNKGFFLSLNGGYYYIKTGKKESSMTSRWGLTIGLGYTYYNSKKYTPIPGRVELFYRRIQSKLQMSTHQIGFQLGLNFLYNSFEKESLE